MHEPSSENQYPKKNMFRRTWFWILIGLILVGVLFYIMLPVGIDYGIESYLKDQGADQVSLADVSFNPITGRLTLKGLTVIIDAQTVLQIPEATLKLQWTPFVRKRFVLERFAISDTELIVKELEDGNWQIGGITLPREKEPAEPSAWDFGLQQVTIQNSIIKLVSSQLTSEVKIEQAQVSKMTSWMPESSARLEFTGQLNGANLGLQMDVSPFGSEIAASGRIGLQGLPLEPFVPLLQPHLKTLEGRLDIDVNIDTRLNADGGLNHHQKGSVKLHQIRTRMADMNLAKESLDWNGAIRVNIGESSKALKIIADGQLNGSGLKLEIENENLAVQQKNFNWKGKIDFKQDKTRQNLKADGQIGLADLKIESPQFSLTEEKLTWQGPVQVSSTAGTEGQGIIADGMLSGEHLQVDLPGRKLKVEHRGLLWKGRLDFSRPGDFNSLKAAADFSLKDIGILHAETSQRLLNLNGIDLQAIRVESPDKISVSGIVLKELAMLSDPETEPSSAADLSALRIQEVAVKNVRLSQQKELAIETINLKAVKGLFHRHRDGKLAAIERWNAIQGDIFPAAQADQTATDTAAGDKTGAFKFRIGQVDISGDSELQFKDDSVDPAFSMDLKILEAHLSELDNNRPEQPASVKLLLSDKKDGRLSLNGTLQPFSEKLSLDWVAKIVALDLPPLSPYVIQSTGYRFTSGEMQADVPVKINQNQLEGKIGLVLYNPKVEEVKAEGEQSEEGKIKLSMSLDSALKVMRDKQNNVRLNIPVSGDISDPKFSVADAVNKVLAKTLQKSALTYVKFMLGPYGIGIAAAEQLIGSSSNFKLNPIQFSPGSDQLDEAAIDYLERVAAILKEHPKVQVVVCGVATESDRASLIESPSTAARAQPESSKDDNSDNENSTDAGLLELAENRSERIKEQLVKVNEIASNRIIDCESQIDKNTEARPRADLEI